MSDRPRLLDLFCGAGGCTKGYQRSGFDVVGVDHAEQPRYCGDWFVKADAVQLLDGLVNRSLYMPWPLESFAAIHASPPCQAHSTAAGRARKAGTEYRDYIADVRDLLSQTTVPWVIENVVGAPLENPVRLCGSSFGLPLRRHRLFESNVPLMAPPCDHSWQTEPRYWTSWRPNGEHRRSTVVQVYGNGGDQHEWGPAMGIDWMTPAELAEAIPPVFTQVIGAQLLQHITTERQAV